MREFVNPEATKYHNARLMYHIRQGMSPEEAENHADRDLVEWSQPLSLGGSLSFEEAYGIDEF